MCPPLSGKSFGVTSVPQFLILAKVAEDEILHMRSDREYLIGSGSTSGSSVYQRELDPPHVRDIEADVQSPNDESKERGPILVFRSLSVKVINLLVHDRCARRKTVRSLLWIAWVERETCHEIQIEFSMN